MCRTTGCSRRREKHSDYCVFHRCATCNMTHDPCASCDRTSVCGSDFCSLHCCRRCLGSHDLCDRCGNRTRTCGSMLCTECYSPHCDLCNRRTISNQRYCIRHAMCERCGCSHDGVKACRRICRFRNKMGGNLSCSYHYRITSAVESRIMMIIHLGRTLQSSADIPRLIFDYVG